MGWTENEVRALTPILERVESALGQLACARVLVLCSAGGDLALRLAPRLGGKGKVTGLELDPVLLRIASGRAAYSPVGYLMDFKRGERARLPFPDSSFDALVRDLIVFPTPAPTETGYSEMARVLRPGGRMVLTDIVVHPPLPPLSREALRSIGIAYVRDSKVDDLKAGMGGAGLADVGVEDLSPIMHTVWEARRGADRSPGHGPAYETLLGKGRHSLGKGLRYVLLRCAKA